MSIEAVFIAGGALFMLTGLAAGPVRRTPLTFPLMYLLVGLIVGPSVLGWLHFNPYHNAGTLELVSECAVLISLYYLSYAVSHGLPQALAVEMIHITLVVVTLSIIVHGLSLRPLMHRFRQARRPDRFRHNLAGRTVPPACGSSAGALNGPA